MHVIVATLNGLAYTQRLLTALATAHDIEHVTIVDNGSTDGTPEWVASLRQRNPETGADVPVVAHGMTLIRHGVNTGASAAWNLGIRLAMLSMANRILICGNDTVPMPGTVERLSALLEQGVQFVTGTAVPYDKSEVHIPLAQPTEPLLAAPDFSFFMFNPAVVELLARYDSSLEFNVLAQVKAQTAEGQPIQRPPILAKGWDYGLFDERYELGYGGDNDYHLRMQRAGLVALRDPMAEFRHETSLTIRINPDVGQLNQQIFPRNMELFRAKWGGFPHEVEAIPGSNLYPIGARPMNVTPEQWGQMSGGHPILEMSREQAVAQAQAVYRTYGLVS